MLKSIDVLIGLTVVMLLLSMAVTVITQFGTGLVNSRGRHLKRGLADLLRQLDPELKEHAESIAHSVLTHPLVSSSSSRLGSVVHREEFTKLLMHLAGDRSDRLADATKIALKQVLEANGIPDPDKKLKSIRTLALELESVRPELAADARQALAIAEEASSDLVAKINGWFDQTMDRVSQRFTASTRAITFVGAVVVAGALQVDTVALVNRLSTDDHLRAALAQEAIARGSGNEQGAGLAALDRYGIVTLPRTVEEWGEGWSRVNLFGVLVTALLLSMGAPFWYKMLGGLLQLRSLLAVKDDEQRASRQKADPPPAASPASAALGERGNLVAVG